MTVISSAVCPDPRLAGSWRGIPCERIYVLGDTPHDIACGRAIGARTVAVATGIVSKEELAAHRPDFLFEDFSNTAEVLAIFGNGEGPPR